jgi:hypothetical protein
MLDTRQFADWSMAFHDLSAPDAVAIPSRSKFLNTPRTGPNSRPTRRGVSSG